MTSVAVLNKATFEQVIKVTDSACGAFAKQTVIPSITAAQKSTFGSGKRKKPIGWGSVEEIDGVVTTAENSL